MAARLTDKRKKKIIADYVQLGSYNAVSKINGVSATTVKNVVLKSADFVEKCEQKKEENTADILTYMESQKGLVCEIIGKGLAALNDPEKLAEATPAQITTALIDFLASDPISSGYTTFIFSPRSRSTARGGFCHYITTAYGGSQVFFHR